MADQRFTVEIRDYEAGLEPDALTTGRIERAIQKLLDKDGSDGVVIISAGTLDLSPRMPEREQILHDLHVHDPAAGYNDRAKFASVPITELRKRLDAFHGEQHG